MSVFFSGLMGNESECRTNKSHDCYLNSFHASKFTFFVCGNFVLNCSDVLVVTASGKQGPNVTASLHVCITASLEDACKYIIYGGITPT